jgi:hypothetical protein
MPLALPDDEFAAVQAAAAPIHPLQRDAFLKALGVELERGAPGGQLGQTQGSRGSEHPERPPRLGRGSTSKGTAARPCNWASWVRLGQLWREPNADKERNYCNLKQLTRRRHLNAGQRAIMLAEAYPEPTDKGGRGHTKPLELREVHSSDLSRARAICRWAAEAPNRNTTGEAAILVYERPGVGTPQLSPTKARWALPECSR